MILMVLLKALGCLFILRGNSLHPRRRPTGVRHLLWSRCRVAPPILQPEVVGEFFIYLDLRRRDADRPHRFAWHNAEGG